MGSSSKSSSSSQSAEYANSLNTTVTNTLAQGAVGLTVGSNSMLSADGATYKYGSDNTTSNWQYSLGASSPNSGGGGATSGIPGLSLPANWQIWAIAALALVLTFMLRRQS